MATTVAVVGGGYGGVTVARALDDVADVVLIEPHDTFVHNVAALRAVADPAWADRMFLPYDRLLTRGQVRRDRAVRVSAETVDLGLFAAGDITAVPELKMARLAQKHADVVAANIRTLIQGGDDLVAYRPEPDAIVLPLGPKGGVSYAPEVGVLDAAATSDIKGDLYLDVYLDLLGLAVTP